MHVDKPKAVVLLSGGLDSATVLAMATAQGYSTYALTFAYGQRQVVELAAARRLAQAAPCQEHRVVTIDLAAWGGSALTDVRIAVPKNRPLSASEEGGVPSTYVPARNTIFLSYALAWAEVLSARDIFIGVNAVDYSGYPDCRPAFIAAFEALANLATKTACGEGAPLRIHAPLQYLSKAQIIAQGAALGVDFAGTHSCYDPIGHLACGQCDACQLRRAGFQAAQVPDPTRYAA